MAGGWYIGGKTLEKENQNAEHTERHWKFEKSMEHAAMFSGGQCLQDESKSFVGHLALRDQE